MVRNMSTYQRWYGTAASLLLLAVVAPPASAIKPFTLVEDGYPEAKGQLELENTFELTFHPREEHSFKELVGEHELEYGLAQDFTLRVKGSYVYTDSHDFTGLHFDAAGVEGQYYFTNPNTDPIGSPSSGRSKSPTAAGSGPKRSSSSRRTSTSGSWPTTSAS